MASKVGAAFSTADAAAIAAIEEINPTSIKNKWEYAGRIYTRSGQFYFTRATTIRNPNLSEAGPPCVRIVVTPFDQPSSDRRAA